MQFAPRNILFSGLLGFTCALSAVAGAPAADLDALPGTNADEFISDMKARINDPRVTVEIITVAPDVGMSRSDTPLFAAIRSAILKRNPGAIVIYDVKSTRNLKPWIAERGGVPLLWKTGHSLIKRKIKESGALLAGEMSGHAFFKERWYGFDDGLYAGARLLEILSRERDPSAALAALPDSVSTPELTVAVGGESSHALIEQLAAKAQFPGAADVIRIDGLRVEYDDGFGLARASNTTPVIVLRFEGESEPALKRIQAEFRRAFAAALPAVKLPF